MNKIQLRNTITSKGFKKYFFNTSWLFATQGTRLFVGFFVSLWVARYLGPEQFGIYNYVMSWIYIFVAISSFGVTDILVQKLISQKEEIEVLNTAFYLRLIAGIISFLLLLTSLGLYPQDDFFKKAILLVSPILIIHALDVIDFFYIAKVKARESSFLRIIQLLVTALIKVYLIISHAELLWFILMTVFDALFYSIVIYLRYRSKYQDFIFKTPNIKNMLKMGKQAFPIMILSISTLVFVKSNQILIGNLISQQQLGLYSSALRIIELVAIFSLIITQSVFPSIIRSKELNTSLYLKRFSYLSRIVLFSGIIFTAIISLFSNNIILILFGESFLEAKDVLILLSFIIPFMGMQNISHRWYITENLQYLLIIKSVMLPIFNIFLSYILISKYGIKGAAYASLTSYFSFFFLFEAVLKRTRKCFYINLGFRPHN